MTDERDILSEAEQMSALLPWYVTDRLSADERRQVDDYAARHPAFARELALAREEADVVFELNEAIAPPAGGLDRLRRSVAATPQARVTAAKQSFIDKLASWLDGIAPRHLAYATMAAALALILQAVALTSVLPSRSTGGFETASHTPDGGAVVHAIVTFAADAGAGAITQTLVELNARIVDGPRAGGLYRVQFMGDGIDDTAISARIAQLKSRTDVIGTVIRAPADRGSQ